VETLALLLLLAQQYPPELPPLIDPMRAAAQSMGAKLIEDFPVADQQTVVTVLVAYSQDKWIALGGRLSATNTSAMQRAKVLAHAQSIVDQWNLTRTNSMDSVASTIMPMELGGIMLTSYTTGQPNHDGKNAHGDSMLGWMSANQSTINDGGLPEITAERNRIGADEVLSISGTDACGLSYECSSDVYALASAEIGCSVSNKSGIHEMGHTMCGNHEPQTLCNAAACPGTYDAGYGWGGPLPSEHCTASSCSGGAVERDPLTYPREGGSRVFWWSSPRKTRVIDGITYTIGRAGMNDNALAISRQSPLTANYRVTTGAGPLPFPAVPGKPVTH
jgi:hypothetical protein